MHLTEVKLTVAKLSKDDSTLSHSIAIHLMLASAERNVSRHLSRLLSQLHTIRIYCQITLTVQEGGKLYQ